MPRLDPKKRKERTKSGERFFGKKAPFSPRATKKELIFKKQDTTGALLAIKNSVERGKYKEGDLIPITTTNGRMLVHVGKNGHLTIESRDYHYSSH